MSSSSVQPAADALEVLAFARLCPLADGDADNQSIEYEILRDAAEDDEEEPEEVRVCPLSRDGPVLCRAPYSRCVTVQAMCARFLL